MAIAVPTLYNAAINGMVAGLMAGRPNTDTTAADYAAFTAAAVVFATALDTSVGADATLATAGATNVPATAANQNAAISKPSLMQDICAGYWWGKGLNGTAADTVAATYTTAVAVVKALYTEAIASQSTS